ncbi:MAG: hypothetical protein Q4P06_08045 [Actinomycetaceae bacterium]|nr:hypothetical protein [Actinomycetaceae bacterium]
MTNDIDQVVSDSKAKMQGLVQNAVQGGYFLAAFIRGNKASKEITAAHERGMLEKNLDALHNVEKPIYMKLLQDRFYLEAAPHDIAHAYQTALAWQSQEPEAHQAVEYANEKLMELYDLDVQPVIEHFTTQMDTSTLDEQLSGVEDSFYQTRSVDAQIVDTKENREASNLVENSDDLQMDPTGDKILGAAADAEVEDAQQARETHLQYKDMENAMRARHGDSTGTAVSLAKAGVPGDVGTLVKNGKSSTAVVKGHNITHRFGRKR